MKLAASGLAVAAWAFCLPLHAQAANITVTMNNMKFSEAPVNLKVGDVIDWKNDDMFRHTATVDGVFNVDLKPGAHEAVTLKKAGVLNVYCRFHPTMKLRLVVAK